MTSNNSDSSSGALARHRILLTDTNRWPVTARLATAFHQMGAVVAVLCPVPGHPAQKLSAAHTTYRYSGNQPLRSLERAIGDFDPEIVIPACDRGVRHLHRLHKSAKSRCEAGQKLAALIERSLGDPAGYPVITSRFDLLHVARTEGILVPETTQVFNPTRPQSWRGTQALPLILKADGTWGGRGVRHAVTLESARSELLELARRPGPLKMLKQLILNRNRDWIMFDWKCGSHAVIAQSIISGRPANCAVVCWEGKVLAGIAVEVVRARGEMGPSTIVEVVESPDMMIAAERIASRLHLSGFFGFDFMIENGTGAHYLIEMNPRCTPPCSLALGEGRDLVAALCAKITGQNLCARTPRTDKSKIAYFPQAASDEADAAYARLLDSAYLDIPEDEPSLVHEFLSPWSERSLAGRALDRLRALSGKKKDPPDCSFEAALRNRRDDS